MSTDGQDFKQPVDPSADTQPQPVASATEGLTEQQQSRRKFLRTAVVSGVAVAAVGATAGVAAASNGHTGLLKNLGIVNFGPQSGSSCGMCWEDTEFDKITQFNVSRTGNGTKQHPYQYQTQPGEFWIWFIAQNVPNGYYVITISPDPGAAPFEYANSGNSAFLFDRASGTTDNCPKYQHLPTDHVRAGHTVSGLFGTAYQVTDGPAELMVVAHIDWQSSSNLDSGDHTYSFTGNIYSTSGSSYNPGDLTNPLCTASIGAKAIKNY